MPTTFELWYGRDAPPAEPRPLRAGPVTAFLDGRDLRFIRYGDVTLVDRVYVAVRDRAWGTVPGAVSNLVVADAGDRFTVTFEVVHRQHDVDLVWRGEIVGQPDGTIGFSMDGVANAEMTYKLIGFNTLHGMRGYAGRPYRGETPAGAIGGRFPTLVEPQYIEDLTEVPIFPAVRSLTVTLTDEVEARFDFEGDTFEVEDQRNWTDASFKAQSFPPRGGGVLHARPGDRIRQKVSIIPIGTPPPARPRAERILLTVGARIGQPLPPIGFGMASHGRPLSSREADLLRALEPNHLRIDLDLADPSHEAELVRAVETGRALGCGLELALFITDEADRQLTSLAALLTRGQPAVRRVLVFHEHEEATPERWLQLTRDRLRAAVGDVLCAGGTNANFCELNRHRPEWAPPAGVVYGVTPQVHAFDELSITENLAAQAETVRTAGSFAGDRPVIISPVTLKRRGAASAPLALDELPAQVDPRQMSLFGAGWTVGSVKYLAESGAASLTYYETTGWRGVIETDAGSPLPERFPARPGMVFPMYHVFADLAEWKGGHIVAVTSSDHLGVDGLAVQSGDALHLLVANFTPEGQRVLIDPVPDGPVRVRRLNAETAPLALGAPAQFRSAWSTVVAVGGRLALELGPFEVVRVDASLGA